MLRPILLRLCWLLAAFPLAGANAAEPPTIRLASLAWLPYVGPNLPQGGLSGAVAEAAAKDFGHRVRVDYFPWMRAMQVGGKDPEFSGYFPAYYTEERARQCHFSAPMGVSTVGLAYLRSKPVHWQSLPDLAGKLIGVVAGYSNGEAFDALVKDGRQKVDVSPSDVVNLQKLLAQRVDGVAIDKSVLRYLLATDLRLIAARDQIAFHDKPLAELTLHICFQRTLAGWKLQQNYDKGLRRIDIRKIENDYFKLLEARARPGPAN
ncbi:MAG TPA: transporter substrate-binding domain-containing protein [Paucimonas sp.]|nr:transporter substrate-binding domain-containing protein [Paucimonas sp.]